MKRKPKSGKSDIPKGIPGEPGDMWDCGHYATPCCQLTTIKTTINKIPHAVGFYHYVKFCIAMKYE